MDIKVHENFMNYFLFLKLKETMNSQHFPWFKSRIVPETEDVQLIHTFFEFDRINSEYFELLEPCIKSLGAKRLIRVKANLVLKTPEIQEHGFHIDNDSHKEFRTAVFYINSNNGYTRFEKKNKKIKSEENKLVEFDGYLRHTGTSCTDAPYRMVINFVYLNK
tara:strand:+ start:131 stop:619 length:489 start_codon:yes stop_codon:yes gene_type:complete